MPSSRSSISGTTHSASNGAAVVQSDIAATAAAPTQRSGVQLSKPAGLESLSGRRSLRDSRAGSGIGMDHVSRAESLQYGMAARPTGSSSHSGAWRKSLGAGSGGSESTPAGLEKPESGNHSLADLGNGNISRSESLQNHMPMQPAGSDPPSGGWRESLRAGSGGAGSSGGESLPTEIQGSSFGAKRQLGPPWGIESFAQNRRSGFFMDHRGKEYSKSALNARGYWMTPSDKLVTRSDVHRYRALGIRDQQQYEEHLRGERDLRYSQDCRDEFPSYVNSQESAPKHWS